MSVNFVLKCVSATSGVREIDSFKNAIVYQKIRILYKFWVTGM